MSQEVYWVLCKCPKRELILSSFRGTEGDWRDCHLKADAVSDTGGDPTCLSNGWRQAPETGVPLHLSCLPTSGSTLIDSRLGNDLN